ncbi:hypothetical protein EV188_1045 [Actinomycetospora succinea]|uniref:VIT family protein n=1 Tax=Actinomycetospora succinea TaxID=663603 RepID=A0A4R6V925_9PSEU|nr:hypothetical protein [Actinomycetospora succinea]TDQ58266.1 hypothetical protein EV188_1045 [Actinomycetospora succinea]
MSDWPVVRIGPLALDIEIGVEGTVVLMTVLVVALDDGIEDFPAAGQMILGSLIATFAAHLFATSLARRARQDLPPPTRPERRRLWRHSSQFLLLGVVPMVVVVLGGVTGLYTPETAIDAVIWLGLAFLVLIGGVGGWRGRRRVTGALRGAFGAGVLGLLVLLLRLVLEH